MLIKTKLKAILESGNYASKNEYFSLIPEIDIIAGFDVFDRQTEQPTDRQTYTVSYRSDCPSLKMLKKC